MSVNTGIKVAEKPTTVGVNLQRTAYHEMTVVGQVTHASTEESTL